MGVGDPLANHPNSHFIHPPVFVDIEGKREGGAGNLGYKIISLYKTPRKKKE
jgi:hypothetical protein